MNIVEFPVIEVDLDYDFEIEDIYVSESLDENTGDVSYDNVERSDELRRED